MMNREEMYNTPEFKRLQFMIDTSKRRRNQLILSVLIILFSIFGMVFKWTTTDTWFELLIIAFFLLTFIIGNITFINELQEATKDV